MPGKKNTTILKLAMDKQEVYFFLGTQALQDAGLDYSSIEQAVVGYCFGKNFADHGNCKEKNTLFN